jgi:hypothetical protein
MEPDPDYVMALIRHRAPEVCDYVVDYELLSRALDVIYAITERVEALSEAVDGQSDGGHDGQPARKGHHEAA